MRYDELVRRVQERAGLEDRDDAERTVWVVLQELCDRISAKEGRDLLAQLPGELQRVVVTSPPQPLSYEDLLRRVADELGVDRDEARRRARAVVSTLREAVSWGELQDVLEETDPEYADLLTT
jgi:uncharacterized protein (DUF2267 family)